MSLTYAAALHCSRRDDLSHIRAIGTGAFGRVMLVRHSTNQKVYALKEMLISHIVTKGREENAVAEKNTMLAVDHDFILRLFTTFACDRKVYMLLEFIQGGELLQVLEKKGKKGLMPAEVQFYAGPC